MRASSKIDTTISLNHDVRGAERKRGVSLNIKPNAPLCCSSAFTLTGNRCSGLFLFLLPLGCCRCCHDYGRCHSLLLCRIHATPPVSIPTVSPPNHQTRLYKPRIIFVIVKVDQSRHERLYPQYSMFPISITDRLRLH